MKRRRRKSRRDPVISLINIVFLILIFFMITGTLAAPPDPSIRFVQTADLDCCVPPDAVAISRTGEIRLNGSLVSGVAAILEARDSDEAPVRLLPDRDLPAHILLENVRDLREAGVSRIIIVTENSAS